LGLTPTKANFGSCPKWTPTMSPHGAKAAQQNLKTARCYAKRTTGQKEIAKGTDIKD